MAYSNINELAFDQRDARDAEMERDAEHRAHISPNQFDVSDDVLVQLEKEPGAR